MVLMEGGSLQGWHEPCESRGSSTESVRGSGCNSLGLLGGWQKEMRSAKLTLSPGYSASLPDRIPNQRQLALV
jgi:hypothetical protein